METFRKEREEVLPDANIPDSLNAINADTSAWILVGGRSSRMGTDKARAASNGRMLALRIADVAASVCQRVSLVGDPAIYAELGLPVIPDRFPGQGPLAGMEAALGASATEVNLILACDIPAIKKGLLQELLTETADDCVIPRHEDGKLEPLCAVYKKRCHPVILEALKTGVRRVTDVLSAFEKEGLAVRYVRVSDPAALANLNTPEDWRRYHDG